MGHLHQYGNMNTSDDVQRNQESVESPPWKLELPLGTVTIFIRMSLPAAAESGYVGKGRS